MKKSNIKRILSGVFAMLMVCCIAFTTQGLTVNAAIVSGGKKNYSYKELKTDLRIKDIADAVGFKESYYFSKTFKRETGMWPTEYSARDK